MPSQVPPASRSRPARACGWSSQKPARADARPKYSSRLAATIRRQVGCARQASAMRHTALEASEDFLLARGPGSEQRGEAVTLRQLGELGLEARAVGHVLVDLHPGRFVVPAPQQAPADARGVRQRALQ